MLQRLRRGPLFALCLLAISATAQDRAALDEPLIVPLVDAEVYGVDGAHSTLTFTIRFLGMADVTGGFDQYRMAILYNDDAPENTSLSLTIDVNSVDTGNGFRDRDLKSERFFHSEKHEQITFHTERVEKSGDGYLAHGPLTIKGITKEVSVPFQHVLPRTVDDAWGNVRVGFSGSITLNRNDFDIHGGDFWGVKALAEEVSIDFFVLATKSNVERFGYNSREKPSIGEHMEAAVAAHGVERALEEYHELKAADAEAFNFAEGQMNLLAYRLMFRGDLEGALQILLTVARENPESAGAFDSLGEAHATLGHRDEALSAYERALELDPTMVSAEHMIRSIGLSGTGSN